MKKEARLIALSDDFRLEESLVILKTNAPVARLKSLQKECSDLFIKENYDNIPNWSTTLEHEGHMCDYIDSEVSKTSLQKKYPEIKEFYYVDLVCF